MSTGRKTIFSAGLKTATHEDPKYTAENVKKFVAIETEKLNAAGIDIEPYFVDQNDPSTIENIKQALRDGKFDGVTVGFGLRGTPELTPLFEQVINTVLENANPTPRMVFPVGPDNLSEAVFRVFPECKK